MPPTHFLRRAGAMVKALYLRRMGTSDRPLVMMRSQQRFGYANALITAVIVRPPRPGTTKGHVSCRREYTPSRPMRRGPGPRWCGIHAALRARHPCRAERHRPRPPFSLRGGPRPVAKVTPSIPRNACSPIGGAEKCPPRWGNNHRRGKRNNVDDETRRMLNDILGRLDRTPRLIGGQYVFTWSENWSRDGAEVVMTEKDDDMCNRAEPYRNHVWRP